MNRMKKIGLVFLLLFVVHATYANRVNVKIMNHLRTDVEISKEELDVLKRNNRGDYPSDKWKRYNQLNATMQSKFSSYIQDIKYKIGSNANVNVTDDAPSTIENFVLDFGFFCFLDELPNGTTSENSPGIQACYTFYFFIDLIDPHTKLILDVYDVKASWTTTELLGAEEMSKMAYDLLLKEDQMPKVKEIEEAIRKNTLYNKATIYYSENEQVADGNNNGQITVSNIKDLLTGEARHNTVCRFKLEAERGTFTDTGTHWVEFDGKDEYYNNDKISFGYQSYKCSDYDNNKEFDTFTLTEIMQMAESSANEVQVQKIKFKCAPTYNIYAHYHSDDFADAKVVWRNVKIVIPSDLDNMKIYNSNDFKGSEDEIAEQMKSVEIPYALNIAGYGKEYYFSQCESEYETPEEVSMNLLSGEGTCFIDKGSDALNSFSIEMIPEAPNVLKVVLQFDMYVGESKENSMQMTVGTDTEMNGGTNFVWEQLDDDVRQKLQAGESAQKVLTNKGGSKLTITFEPN